MRALPPFLSVESTQGFARATSLQLHHGKVQTPAFMPVGTLGTVKTLAGADLVELGAQILLSNTYHLYLRPGLEVLRQFGGLHRWVGWEKPILTDSGGFQVFSLGLLRKVTEEGVVFRSHLNGDTIQLTPERCAEIQQVIGSDIAMILDECVAYPAPEEQVAQALQRTLRWTQRFCSVSRLPSQKIFGIVQGGVSPQLRRESLEGTLALGVDGIAVGGLSVGEPHALMVEVLEQLAPLLPRELPHYLMGVGTPLDILEGVRCGIDLFDCVLPSRNGRNGGLFTPHGLLNIRNQQHRLSEDPIDANCSCSTCRNYSRSYLRHLFLTKEILGARLATEHNLHYYFKLMSELRQQLLSGTFESYYLQQRPLLAAAYGPERKNR